ncbi:MAG: Ig-like domain-containing protein [Verrucomicrobiota bacterium]
MKTTQVLACSLAVGAMIFAAGKASADVIQKLNISGLATYRVAVATNTTDGGYYYGATNKSTVTYKTKTVSFNDKTIIAALNASEAFTNKAGAKLTIPRGSYLAIDNDTNGNSYIIATNRADNLIINLTTNGFANMWVGDVDITSGKLNTSTKQYSASDLGLGCIEINNQAGTSFKICGLMKSSESGSKPKAATHLQTVIRSDSITGSGEGTYTVTAADIEDTIVRGKATASGKGVLIPTPLTVIATIPANNAPGVPINSQLAVTFSEEMNPATINDTTFILKQGTTPVTGTVSYVNGTAIFTPATALTTNALYTATITTGAKTTEATDLDDNALATDFVWSFTTSASTDATRPTVIAILPADNTTGVPINSQLAAIFSKAMNPATITTANFTLTGPGGTVTGTVAYVAASRIATFTPASNLAPGTTYTNTITTGATDLAGNALATNFVWSFTTGASTDTTAPTVSSTIPTDTAMGVPINQTINATFSKAMDPATITSANFTVTGPDGTVTGTVAYVAASQIATFTPASNLAPGTMYTNTITTGVTDMESNALATSFVWNFTTGTQIETNLMSISLGRASTFAIMATAAISGGGDQINGDVGLYPGSAQGIPPSEINGTIHVDDQAIIGAQADLLAAYNDAVSRSVNAQTLQGNLGGLTKTPGLYVNSSSVEISGTGANAILTLDAQGDANAVFIFKMASTLTIGTGTSIVLSGGAQAKNVYWQVGSSATLGTTSIFKGNILAAVTITVNNGAAVEGRLFAGSGGGGGSVTVQSSTITVPAP